MALRPQMPDLKCMDPENYRKYFRALCWSSLRKSDKRSTRKLGRKEKLRRLKAINVLAVCYAPKILPNPSQFAVYATVRKAILSRWRHVHGFTNDNSDDSDSDDYSPQPPIHKVPKITGIGLRAVFTLISQARFLDSNFCEHALRALLDVLQGHAPEELAQEPPEMISSLQSMLIEIASGSGPSGRMELPSTLTAISSSCLMALCVARGEVELILTSVASLIMAPPALSDQYIKIPYNLTTLQRSVQSIILGPPSRNQWLHYGVPHQSLATTFPVDLPPQVTAGSSDLVVRSLVSDGCFLYVYTSRGLLKIGSGYGTSIKQHVYLYKPDFFASDRHGWLGFCKNKLYVRIGRKKPEVYEVDKDTLEIKTMVRLDPGGHISSDQKSAVFTDGKRLGLVMLSTNDILIIKMYDVDTPNDRPDNGIHTVNSRKDLSVHLLRRRTLALGKAPFEDGLSRRATDLDSPMAMQFDDTDDDPLMCISAGQDFGLLITGSGKVYYTGKGTSLGYKITATHTGRWTLMKETLFNRHDPSNTKKCKVIQVAVGHEGVHAILVLDNGTALFTGIARRGEDGDNNKHRRSPKPTRPRKIQKADGHYIVYAACNYGSTALVTRQGLLLMFGKDTQHCDANGIITDLRHERIVQVALGKAHAVALTSHGQVYTFGINNKGQCGREFGYTKERPYPPSKRARVHRDDLQLCTVHTWTMDFCRVCVLCKECTGYFSACNCTLQPEKPPGERCGCGEGDAGCTVCGVCRRCAELHGAPPPERADSDEDAADPPTEADGACCLSESNPGSDSDKDSSLKLSCLAPARIAIPGGHRVLAVACGLHHTVLLLEEGEVLTFGSNQFGALGAGDIAVHHRLVRVRVPRALAVTAGSNHTAVLTVDGELYTFGAFVKGALGRPRVAERKSEARNDRGPIWYATPGRVPRIGPRYANQAVWVSASGDQTFVQVSQTLIKTDTIFSATITANSNTIMILPNRPEHEFKCITINKIDGSCNAWPGPEQVDFVNTLACLDPLYDVLWCYQPGMRLMKCYNILAFDSHKLQRCCFNDPDSYAPETDFDYPNYGTMRRLEDFKNLENFEFVCNSDQKHIENMAMSNMSILNHDLAIPSAHGCFVTRMHAALHLLGCLDSLAYAHDMKLATVECKRENSCSPILPVMEDFYTVNRFESHGGGWGYSGHSVEAIRFMCDNDILLGGFGLYGGRGDYAARIKLFDIGPEGGEQEGDGDLVAESDEVTYECPPRDKFPMLFENPVPLAATRWYVAWACINGPSSDCGSCGLSTVINDEVSFHFKSSKRSNNGTDVNAGQIPCLLYNINGSDQLVPIRNVDFGEPVISLSKNLSRKITVNCFRSLIHLLQWSWTIFKEILLDTNGQVPINYQKLTTMKHQKRLVYVIRACIRLVKSYTNEIYPKNNRRRNSHDYMPYLDIIGEARNYIQGIMADATPTCSMLPRKVGRTKSHRVCYVQFALEMTNSILNEAHETVVSCFHAFFPNPALKWNYLCSLLYHVKDGVVPPSQVRALTAACAALCDSRSLCEVLQYIVPVTQNSLPADRPESRIMKDIPSKSATVPRSSHSQKPPPIPPRSNRDNNKHQQPQEAADDQPCHEQWDLMDAVPRLLDVATLPLRRQMAARPCAHTHDHGEIAQRDRLVENCCKFTARLVGDLTYNASNEDMGSNTVRYLMSPSRFMRVNQSRVWNTGNGTPDAICFSVDRAGVALVGACVYGGSGTYDYTLELLHDVRLKAPVDETNPSHCWVSVDTVHGTFTGVDLQHDMVQVKFGRPIPLKEELRYALRLCNQGARTASGDCGLPSVNGPDGTTFTFSSCSLSFNGTSLARGQIPCLIYQGSSKLGSGSEGGDRLYSIYRGIALRVGGDVVRRGASLLGALRAELPADELRRNAAALHLSPLVTTLLPYTLANLDELDDPMSSVQILEMIHELLPHVAALNQQVPPAEEPASAAPSPHYTWVESEHPYKQSVVSNMRVLFPPQVSWMVLEMDPRSITAQPEDTLTIYAVAGAPKHKCHCSNDIRIADPPFRKRLVQLTSETGEVEELDDANSDAPCTHYNCTYVSVTPKLSNVHNAWPKHALLVPGNEVIFSLETASDYLNEYNKIDSEENRFGFRCLCVGYEDAPFASQRQGLTALEMELVYAGAACATRLLAPDLDIPPLHFSTIMELQMSAASGSGESESCEESDALLLARGLELSSPPTVHQVLDGLPLMRSASTERKFLSDFVSGAESTAGGRLACWLAPAPRVVPTNCEMKPPTAPVRPATKVNLPVIVKDQYGEAVTSPALKVEVVVQRLEEQKQRRSSSAERRGSVPDVPYNPVVRETMTFKAITMMKAYQNFSFEELRIASGVWGGAGASAGALAGGGRVPAERISVLAQPDGTYIATWTPRAPGLYEFRCSLDNVSSKQELTIDVVESPSEEQARGAQGMVAPEVPSRLKCFASPGAAALRVRASPSLQAEEIGRVPPAANIAFVEEVVNKDGTWVRLSPESILAYASGAPIAWCMQYHRPYDRTLLQNFDPSPTQVFEGTSGFGDALSTEQPSFSINDDDDGAFGSGDLSLDERKFPFAIRNDGDEGDCSTSSPFQFGAEPSKRERYSRQESASAPTPRRFPRRSNGNADDWWSPVRYRSNEDLRGVSSMPERLLCEDELSLDGRLAQGTQTSPDTDDTSPIPHFHIGPPREVMDACRVGRERNRARFRRASSPPPLPARAPAPAASAPAAAPAPRRHALAPAQAECLRAVFASMLRHEGIVADAIACAAFLKFHPHLPKAGAPVLTRAPHDAPPPRPQRHSVEVSNAGAYLRINPSTLEALARRGAEASASRARRADLDAPIREDEPHSSHAAAGGAPQPSVVNVLPPALRALVALWDALCDSDQLAPATDKYKKDAEANENEEIRPTSGVRRKKDSKYWTSKTPYSVRCELCGGANVAPPLAGHMKQAHPGCRALTSHGYDRAGAYCQADPPLEGPAAACGQLAQAYQLWYIFCENCRERSLKSTSSAKHKTVTIIEASEREERLDAAVDHLVIRDNALFLLDLAPLNHSEPASLSPLHEGAARSPPTPAGSVWRPAPPFQVLGALGAAPRAAAACARYHSLGRPPPAPPAPVPAAPAPPAGTNMEEAAGPSRVHRSVSMGQAGRDLASAALLPLARSDPDPIETLPGAAGSSLLAQPSAALQRLVACGEWSAEGGALSAFEPAALDARALMRSPVMSFVLARKDLHGYRQKMDAAVRVNTVRQYGFEALNWLLRSATQPTCVHDVMWWFCNTLDKYSRIMPLPPVNEDNKENALIEENPRILPTPSASAICPGGKAARGARSAFHAFLGSVSALAPALPPASAAGLQAVRCWALQYSMHDRAFLHRSQVFSVISKILSHGEDGATDEDVLGALHESYHTTSKPPSFVWGCPDVTAWCDVAVSSRQGMAGALTDGSTETFWESGDEDRNRSKWVQISYPGGSAEERPHVVCVHVDNTRDTVNKTLLVSFLFSCGTNELFHMQDLEVDTKSATWLCYTVPRMASATVRVRCELRGPEASVRVRQVRVLGAPALAPAPPPPLHALVERDTLRVFRLLTSQVFGKLLEWEEGVGGEAGEAAPAGGAAADDSDLREHVVGILFSAHKLTSLQCQVMAHIVYAIGCEASRVRDDWETALLCAESAPLAEGAEAPRLTHHQQDNYCFEMLSMLLALSGSAAGRAHLAQRTELLPDLLALLHAGSERVQRQVISLLRRIIIEISPQKMLTALNFGTDAETRVTLLEHLVCYLGKAVRVQVKVKGGGTTGAGCVTMGGSVTPAPPAAWFMRGETLKQHSHLVSKLLLDMAEDKLTPEWGAATREALADYVVALAETPDADRQPARCLAAPTVWMALAALCVCEQAHIDFINNARKYNAEVPAAAPGSGSGSGGSSVAGDSSDSPPGPSSASCSTVATARPVKRNPYRTVTLAEVVVERPPPSVAGGASDAEGSGDAESEVAGARRMCSNHDDGATCAVIDCRTCGPLCAECDRFLHLSRVSKSHQRQICKEEESAIRVDIHEGCGRAKLFWLLLLVDRRTLKALAEFRALEGGVGETSEPSRAPFAGVCRYCGIRSTTGLLAIGNVCADHQCQEHGRESCARVLSCGHACGGVRGERACLPCLFGCGGGDALRQDADDMCMICFTDPLQAAPALQLKCGHVFHLHCCKKVILNKWNGPRITFSFAQCPICKEDMSHWTLEELLAPIKRLREEVRRKALMRLEYEGLAGAGASAGPAARRAADDPAAYAMDRYAYYVCHKCDKAYFGGLARCEAESNGAWEPSELVCGACSDVAGARTCPKHGADFLEYKCRYCCSVAVFFCFGTSHFCNACHDDFQRVTNIPRHMLPQCPAGPKAEQLAGSAEECPLHVQHPPTGEEFALGCGVCRNAHAF